MRETLDYRIFAGLASMTDLGFGIGVRAIGKRRGCARQPTKVVFCSCPNTTTRNSPRACCRVPSSLPGIVTAPPKIMLSTDQMVSLSDCFTDIPDPNRSHGRHHQLPRVLAVAGPIRRGMHAAIKAIGR